MRRCWRQGLHTVFVNGNIIAYRYPYTLLNDPEERHLRRRQVEGVR